MGRQVRIGKYNSVANPASNVEVNHVTIPKPNRIDWAANDERWDDDVVAAPSGRSHKLAVTKHAFT